MRGLMVGRFQPFHLGHLHLAQQIISECDEIIVAVTSAQFNYIKKDPFTVGERIEMVHASLQGIIDMSKCFILPVENHPNNAIWVSYLKSTLPDFERVYTGNSYVAMLFENTNIDVFKPIFLDRSKYNATNIRNMIATGDSWNELVPESVAKLIDKIGGQNRMLTILNSDTNPAEY